MSTDAMNGTTDTDTESTISRATSHTTPSAPPNAIANGDQVTTGRPKQIRGDALVQRIREVVEAHGKAAQEAGKPFILRKAIIAKEVPCTRKTLDTYEEEMNAVVLALFPGARYNQDGTLELERIRAKLKAMEERADKLDQENRRLMEVHTKVFDAIMMAGVHPSIFQGIDGLAPSTNVLAFPPSKT